MNTHNDVMLDLESADTSISPALFQFSAVRFDLSSGETSDEFNMIVDFQSCIDAGLSVGANTIKWWMNQSEEARKVVTQDGEHINTVLAGFAAWLNSFADEYTSVWGNGIIADNVWVNAAYEKAMMKTPIQFWQHKDVRTLVDIGMRKNGKNFKRDEVFTGTPHNAIDDCKHQIKYCSKIFNAL